MSRLSPGYQLVIALNETYLTYKDIRQLAMLLPKRKVALLQATHGQRICWELRRAVVKGVARERDSEVLPCNVMIVSGVLHSRARPNRAQISWGN